MTTDHKVMIAVGAAITIVALAYHITHHEVDFVAPQYKNCAKWMFPLSKSENKAFGIKEHEKGFYVGVVCGR